MKYSFHILIKTNTETVTKPDCAKGSMIFQKAFSRVQPSIKAASSYEEDILEKNESRYITVYGILIPAHKKTSKQRVEKLLSNSFRFATVPYSGKIIIINGTDIATLKQD